VIRATRTGELQGDVLRRGLGWEPESALAAERHDGDDAESASALAGACA
jgi:hypothetical protein